MSTYWDECSNCPKGSLRWPSLCDWAWRVFSELSLFPDYQSAPKGWKIKIGGFRYNEKWLRSYAILRQYHNCMVLCSDFANHHARLKRPIIRSRQIDVRLMMAYSNLVLKQRTNKQRKDRK